MGNAIISEAEYRRQLPSVGGKAFLFFGSEDYLKLHALSATRAQLCPDDSFAFFNDVTIDAIDYTADGLLDAMMPLPMMADYRLVVVRGLEIGSLKAEEMEALLGVLGQLENYPHNTVIFYTAAGQFDAGRPRRPSALLNKLSSFLIPVQFDAVTAARLTAWVAKHFAHFEVGVSPADCAFLVEYCGSDMFTLASQIEKLAYFAKANGMTAITKKEIEAVASPISECGAFALTNAVLDGRYDAALRVLATMKFQRVEPVVAIGEISSSLYQLRLARTLMDSGCTAAEIARLTGQNEFKVAQTVRSASRVNEQRLARAIALCAEADATVKDMTARGKTRETDYRAIEKLICSL